MKKQVLRFSAALVAFFVIMSFNFSALALDNSCIVSDDFWSNCENLITYNDTSGLSGFSKYYSNSTDGCFYLYINFRDNAITDNINENIFFRFSIQNELGNITFDVDKDGFNPDEQEYLKSDIELIYDFNSTSCRNKGGKVIIAFELKNKDYRKQLNSINCDYYCGNYTEYNILENIYLDMRVEETTKTTSKKSTTTNKAAATTKKSTTKRETTTKFVPEKYTTTINKSTAPTKFQATASNPYNEENSSTSLGTSTSSTETVTDTTIQSDVNSEMSTRAKNMVAVAVFCAILGVTAIINGIIKKAKKPQHSS